MATCPRAWRLTPTVSSSARRIVAYAVDPLAMDAASGMQWIFMRVPACTEPAIDARGVVFVLTFETGKARLSAVDPLALRAAGCAGQWPCRSRVDPHDRRRLGALTPAIDAHGTLFVASVDGKLSAGDLGAGRVRIELRCGADTGPTRW